MIYPDWKIRELIESEHVGVDPYDPSLVQPASIDMRLGGELVRVLPGGYGRGPIAENATLHPGEFALASTLETVRLPADVCARFEGKSTLGRLGLATHVTAGFIDPGFHGQITLELVNHSPRPIALTPGMRIGQLCLMPMPGPAKRPYGSAGLGSHYQGQTGPTPATFDNHQEET